MHILIARSLPEPNAESIFGGLQAIPDKPGASVFTCLTQEPMSRADRLFVPGECALPIGTYNVKLEYSKRHRREVPLLAAVRPAVERRAFGYRLGMRIHPGERVELAWGDIIVGRKRAGRTLVETASAFDLLVESITTAIEAGEAVECEISEGSDL